MLFSFDQLNGNQRYHLITQTITPRPIAWIMTKNLAGSYNLAPFSYFAALSSDPALLVVSIGNKDQDTAKDTKLNLLRDKECVLHIPSVEWAHAVNDSAANLAYGESEIEKLGLSLCPFTEHFERLQEAKVALHCRLYDVHNLGDSPTQALYLEILSLHVDDDLITQQAQRTFIDNQKLNPLARLGGNDYAELGENITIKRPN
ncbi:flavin reductase family protein [Marinomonas sp.]